MEGADEGAIVIDSSVRGLRNPNVGFSLYSASKAAVISLTKVGSEGGGRRGRPNKLGRQAHRDRYDRTWLQEARSVDLVAR